MKNIEIATAHNIAISYPLASTGIRFLAYIIDLILLGIYALFASLLFGSFDTLGYIFIFPVLAFYHLVMEMYNRGQSIGKKLLKLRVVTLQGTTPSGQDFFMRWIFRLIDITFTGGTLAVLFVSSTAKNQRIGDILAQTSVIRLEGEHTVGLSAIQKLGSEKMEMLYPAITQFDDQDMLLLKQTLRRYKTHPNEANRKVLNAIYYNIIEGLEIREKITDRMGFLNRVLKEYIILTR